MPKRTSSRPASHLSRGYVFPLALWSLAIIAVLLGAAYTAMNAANANLRDITDRERTLHDLNRAETRLIRLLLTEPMGLSDLHIGGQLDPDPISGGLGVGGTPMSAYGTPYRYEGEYGPVIVRLIAANGLMPFHTAPIVSAQALLESQGHDRSEARQLAARLGDYVDEDDARRLGGAEARDYPQGQTPLNAPLKSAADACHALGWSERVALCEDPRLLELYAFSGPSVAVSARLAPLHLVQLLTDEDRELELALSALGTRTRSVNYSEIGAEGLERLQDSSAVPGPSFLIVTHRPDAQFIKLTRIDLNLANMYKPYDLAYSHHIGGAHIEEVFHVELSDTLASLPQTR